MADAHDPKPHEEDDPIPYKEVTSDDYARHAEETFTPYDPTQRKNQYLRGTCGRCHHEMTFIVPDHLIRGFFHNGPTTSSPEQAFLPMICTCTEDHPGRPIDDDCGCGAYWNMSVRPTS